MNQAILQTNLPFPLRRGKVRDIYDVGDQLLIVSTDRISAFDWVLPNGIPDKGRILNLLSGHWFATLPGHNHRLSTNAADICSTYKIGGEHRAALEGRCMLVKKCEVVPIECVVRGYLDGSGWQEYQHTQSVCGLRLRPGLKHCQQLDEPIFTPATKEDARHDSNIPFERMCELVSADTAWELRRRSTELYCLGAERAASHGIIIADAKFEWGYQPGHLMLVDEVLTPDSSRFWPADRYEPGHSQPSFDKQYVRDWLTTAGWDKNSPPPSLPASIVATTRLKYIQAYEFLTGEEFPWA